MVINSSGNRSITWGTNDLAFISGTTVGLRVLPNEVRVNTKFGLHNAGGLTNNTELLGMELEGSQSSHYSHAIFAAPQANHIPTNLYIRGEDGAYGGGSTKGVSVYIHGGDNTTSTNQGDVILAHDGSSKRGNVGIGTTSPSDTLTINQTADSNGIRINGYDDHSSSFVKLFVDSVGHTELTQSTNGGDGYLKLKAENYLELVAGSFVYTQDEFRIYDAGQLSIGNGADFKIKYDDSSDELKIHTSSNNGITMDSSGRVGIGVAPSSAELEVNGHFAATTKSFIIDNPEKGGRLQYGVVETDEHSVYVRGKSDQNIVELPEEWGWLVDEGSVTVQLTSIGQMQHLFVIKQNNKYIEIGGLAHHGEYNYVVYGTRKDVDPLKKHLK